MSEKEKSKVEIGNIEVSKGTLNEIPRISCDEVSEINNSSKKEIIKTVFQTIMDTTNSLLQAINEDKDMKSIEKSCFGKATLCTMQAIISALASELGCEVTKMEAEIVTENHEHVNIDMLDDWKTNKQK